MAKLKRSSNSSTFKAACMLPGLLWSSCAPVPAQSTCSLDVEVHEAASGELLPGVEVSVLESVRGGTRNRSIGTTDALGKVRGSVDHAGNIIVVAINPGHRNGQASVTSQPGTTQVVLLKVDRGASIIGRLVDKRGKLLPGSVANIQAVPDLGFPGSLLFGNTGTYRGQLKDGRYIIHVPAGRYKIKASMTGRVVESPTLDVGERQQKYSDVTCQP